MIDNKFLTGKMLNMLSFEYVEKLNDPSEHLEILTIFENILIVQLRTITDETEDSFKLEVSYFY
jgi:hypothetical protein